MGGQGGVEAMQGELGRVGGGRPPHASPPHLDPPRPPPTDPPPVTFQRLALGRAGVLPRRLGGQHPAPQAAHGGLERQPRARGRFVKERRHDAPVQAARVGRPRRHALHLQRGVEDEVERGPGKLLRLDDVPNRQGRPVASDGRRAVGRWGGGGGGGNGEEMRAGGTHCRVRQREGRAGRVRAHRAGRRRHAHCHRRRPRASVVCWWGAPGLVSLWACRGRCPPWARPGRGTEREFGWSGQRGVRRRRRAYVATTASLRAG